MNRKLSFRDLLLLLGTIALSSAAIGADDIIAPAHIRFAEIGNIRSWQAVGHDAILFQSGDGHWLRADFTAPCRDLPFAFSISFITEPNGRLDRFSSILVDGQRCWFRSVRADTEPGSRNGRHDIETKAG